MSAFLTLPSYAPSRDKSGCSRRAELLKLRGQCLPVGAYAGVAEPAVLRVIFGHILRALQPIDGIGSMEVPESLNFRKLASMWVARPRFDLE
jgi:hypothetical protein